MSLHLGSIGTALPEHRLTQSDAVELQASFCRLDDKQARTLRALYRRSGIDTRHSVLFRSSEGQLDARQSFYPRAVDEDDRGPTTAARMAEYEIRAPELALAAARSALEQADAEASEITHLVTVSCTGFVSPGVDAVLIERLGLPKSVERTNVGFMGCHGALNGLRVARSFVESDPSAVPLLCAVELCTLHFAYGWDPEMLVANALFADGAAALVGRGNPSSEDDWRVAATGTLLMDGSTDAMTWRVADHGFRMTLAASVPHLVAEHLRPWIATWLAQHGMGIEDIETWAVHPGGPRILGAVEAALELEPEANAVARGLLSECGNMSSPTILFILDRLKSGGAHPPCVALAFGPGLVVEATLLL